jgi:hypothetical protein
MAINSHGKDIDDGRLTLTYFLTIKMKKIYYLAGLPRAGNTLLSCILNQNPKVKVTPNSYLPEIIYRIFLLKGETIFQNFPDHESLDNIIKKIFINYYDNIDAEVIFERSCWGTKFNLEMLKKYYNKNPKFLILNRPIDRNSSFFY